MKAKELQTENEALQAQILGLSSILKSSDEPDRAKVISIGNKVDEVFINDVVLINWNKATKIENETYVVPVTEVVWIY